MHGGQALIGREQTWAELRRAMAAAARGHGGLLLLAGEAGVGKTRLATEALNQCGLFSLRVAANPTTASAYGPLVAALRDYRHRATNESFPTQLPMAAYLAVLLPELGTPPAGADRATVFEAVRCAFEAIARRQPTVVFVDDLHWADHTTLEVLTSLASQLTDVPLLLLGAYRSDELGRDHPLRRMRSDLRRTGCIRELSIEPLPLAETTALAAQLLGHPPTPELSALLQAHAGGLPFLVEELVAGLKSVGRLHETPRGIALADGAGVPVPDSVRDVVLLRTAGLSDAQHAALEVAAVAGVSFDLDLVAELVGGEEQLGELLELGMLVESGPGIGAFRHALIREACYREITWSRRRALHRQVAEHLERRGAAPGVLAEHWSSAHELDRARRALLASMEAACSAYAYRDAAEAGQRALELWPEGVAEVERTAVLDRLGHCAQMSGDLAEAARTWREVAETYRGAGDATRLAAIQRRLAGVYELQGSWERALAAREHAAAAFAASGQPGEAAAERLAAGTHLRSALRFKQALELLDLAIRDARQAGRLDLQARILSTAGNVRARMGAYARGVDQVRAGLALALEHNLSAAAAESYQRLADALEHSGDYPAARSSYLAAADFCQTQGAEVLGQLCLACMTVVLGQNGEWERCAPGVPRRPGLRPGQHPRARRSAGHARDGPRSARSSAARAGAAARIPTRGAADRAGGDGAAERVGSGDGR